MFCLLSPLLRRCYIVSYPVVLRRDPITIFLCHSVCLSDSVYHSCAPFENQLNVSTLIVRSFAISFRHPRRCAVAFEIDFWCLRHRHRSNSMYNISFVEVCYTSVWFEHQIRWKKKTNKKTIYWAILGNSVPSIRTNFCVENQNRREKNLFFFS